jgi:hypothetical protein
MNCLSPAKAVSVQEERVRLERRALLRARELGHTIPRIEWDAANSEGIGTCTRCSDGVLLYLDPEESSINGTACESECPGDTCAHGWQVITLPEGGVLLRCLHCGAERAEW